MAPILTQLVSNRLFEQRTRQDSLSVEKLAVMAAPLFSSADTAALSALLTQSASEMGGRLLALDSSGKVQMDTYDLLYGVRLPLPEVARVLSGEGTAYGIHRLSGEADYAAYCASAMTGGGLILYVSPVQELMDSLTGVRKQLLEVFLMVALAAMLTAMIFSRILTRPISALTKTIQRMGQGDLSARVTVRASGELRDLADSYNAMAEQIEHFDKSRSQFVSNASHELKTPLATMKILLESMLYQPEMPGELREEFMQDMNHEIDRLTSVVTDLLTLTQSDSHESPLRLADENLTALTDETLRLLLPAAQKRQLTVHADLQPNVTARCDAGKVAQIITNLTDNAIKYTPEGGDIRITLTADASRAVLTVADNGEGIPQADQAHVFDRFYRVDKARSRATGGTGLGLSIVRELISMHGGEIGLVSAPGQGSTFTVSLPLRPEVKP